MDVMESSSSETLYKEKGYIFAKQNLFSGGSDLFALEASELYKQSAQWSLATLEQATLISAAAHLLDLVSANYALRVAQTQLAWLHELGKTVQAKFDVEMATQTDLSQVHAQFLAAQAEEIQACNDLTKALLNYKIKIGQAPPKSFIGLPQWTLSLPKDMESGLAIVRNRDPNLKNAQKMLEAQNAMLQSESGQLLPKINATLMVGYDSDSAGGFATSTSSTLSPGYAVSLSLEYPLFAGGKFHSKIKEAQLRVSQESFDLAQTDQALQLEFLSLWQSHQESSYVHQSIEAKHLALLMAFNDIKKSADLGTSTTFDVLEAQKELWSSKKEFIQILTKNWLNRFKLGLILGEITPQSIENQPLFIDNALDFEAIAQLGK
jgi:outer membrane protein TolC